MDALQQVMAALATQDPMLASDLLAHKEEFKRIRHELHLRHIRRLRAGIPSSISSSAVHQDLVHAMSTVLAHTSNIARILQGEIYEEREGGKFTDRLVTLRARLLDTDRGVSEPFSRRLIPLQFRAPTTKLLPLRERESKQTHD